MGNPHPTKSKPIKIGRKHTGAKSVRQQARAKRARQIASAISAAKHKRRRLFIRAFWNGEIDTHP